MIRRVCPSCAEVAQQVLIGWDPREVAAYNVAVSSIVRRCRDVVVRPIKLSDLTGDLLTRPVETKDGKLWCPISQAPMATEFAISRFCVPYMARGWALFVDCDIVCLADISELFELADPKYAVMCVKHPQPDIFKVTYDERCEILDPKTGKEVWRVHGFVPSQGHPADWKILETLIGGVPIYHPSDTIDRPLGNCSLTPWTCWPISDGQYKIISADHKEIMIVSNMEWDGPKTAEQAKIRFQQFKRMIERDPFKMDRQLQTLYQRKNWSSVMLFNCDHPSNQKLTREALNTWPGRDLHAFKWLSDDEIGELPPEWNHLVGISPNPMEQAKILHLTTGGPWFPDWQGGPADDIWRKEFSESSQKALDVV